MAIKIGETPILRGAPPVQRTLEVLVDENWLVSEKLEKCVSFQEIAHADGRVAVIFSRSVSAAEAKAFAELLLAAANLLENIPKTDPPPPDS